MQELRDDNQVLVEQRNEMEEQLELSRRRNETVVEMENEMMRYKEHVQELNKVSLSDSVIATAHFTILETIPVSALRLLKVHCSTKLMLENMLVRFQVLISK